MALKLNKPLLSGTAEVNRMELLLRSDADFDAKISLQRHAPACKESLRDGLEVAPDLSIGVSAQALEGSLVRHLSAPEAERQMLASTPVRSLKADA